MTTLTSILPNAAAATPDKEGLVGLNSRYTWSDLERASGALAGRLIDAGIEVGERVGVAFLKDAAGYIAVHGILRAGAVVVPIDPLAPALLAREVLEDAGVSGVIGDVRTVGAIEPWTIKSLQLKCLITKGPLEGVPAQIWDEVVDSTDNWVAPSVSPKDSAYIIYTSGSSGRSKGILHTHASAMAYAERAVEAHELSDTDRVGGISPFHFDMSTLELYAAPLVRSAVVVMGEAHLRFPASFTARSADEGVTLWYSVPSFFRQLVDRGAMDQRDLESLRLIMYGGEPYSVGALNALMQALPAARVKNIYGPAEVNECTSHYVDELPVHDLGVSIGRPWHGVDLRVVSEDGGTVEPGTPGELWVSAPTVMKGYWNLTSRTEASMHERPGSHPWYATGDIVVEHEGLLWFKGRRDHQVKVRGVRIELEAIETVLADAATVVHAVAATVGEGDQRHIAAAVVLTDGATLDHDQIKQWCTARLPSIAVPREVAQVDVFPSTPTGKIDVRQVRIDLAAMFEHEGAIA